MGFCAHTNYALNGIILTQKDVNRLRQLVSRNAIDWHHARYLLLCDTSLAVLLCARGGCCVHAVLRGFGIFRGKMLNLAHAELSCPYEPIHLARALN